MNILGTQYTLNSKAFEIYVSGCNGFPHCFGCHNPESWDFNQGEKYDENYFEKIKTKVTDFSPVINKIMIFGGEPNDNNLYQLKNMLLDLKTLEKPIWLFTRYDIEEVPKFELELCDYIKCGRYIPRFMCDDNVQYGIKLATSNQKIYKKGLDY